ncbi:Mur ligase domain-containing protein [Pontibacter sp. BAB1700]|uniref:Mur ligase domain-containing protein n=1 Tax=Pontibacter sp. BAB1700 TaxID=1144253 RepID=UPI000314B637
MERTDFKHIHLIATGGSIMHNLALALHDQGIKVTGSDDEIYEPAKSRLAAAGILPAEEVGSRKNWIVNLMP